MLTQALHFYCAYCKFYNVCVRSLSRKRSHIIIIMIQNCIFAYTWIFSAHTTHAHIHMGCTYTHPIIYMCTNTMHDMYMYHVSYYLLDATQKQRKIISTVLPCGLFLWMQHVFVCVYKWIKGTLQGTGWLEAIE